MLDEFTKKRINKIMSDYIEKKVPKHIRNQVKLNYKFRADSVTLIEERIGFKSEQWVQLPVDQFRLEQSKWKVYWRDSKNKWHFVDDITPEEDFEQQLKTVDNDDLGIFWG